MVGQTQVAVEVRDHRVARTTVLHGPGLASQGGHASGTVEDLFTELRNTQRDADAYDPKLCYPTQVRIDQGRNANDDERSFAVEDLHPLSP